MAGASEIDARVVNSDDDDQPQYSQFTERVNGKLVYHDRGGVREAEAFLRHLIDEGHTVAYGIQRDGSRAKVCVSYDADAEDWEPAWPGDFRADVSQTSTPMTRDW